MPDRVSKSLIVLGCLVLLAGCAGVACPVPHHPPQVLPAQAPRTNGVSVLPSGRYRIPEIKAKSPLSGGECPIVPPGLTPAHPGAGGG